MKFASFRNLSLLLLAIFCFFSAQPAQAAVQTGAQDLKDYRYPVSLYVPENYDPEKTYPLLIALPDVDTDPAPYLAEWTQVSKAKGYIILVPTLKIRISEVSTHADAWLLSVKKDISTRYRVNPSRILLTGKKQGAHYAAYLGVRYPEEFTAGAFFGQAWVGPLESVLELKNKTAKQRPFYAVLDGSDENYYKATETFAARMTDKGYPVYLQKVSNEELDSVSAKKDALAWFDEKSESWTLQITESKKGWKAKTSEVFHEFFRVS